MYVIMSLLALSAGFLRNEVMNQSIPTKAEQTNLLLNVQEIFQQVELMTKIEADATDKSVGEDIERTVQRAEYVLDLLENITSLRLSCEGNSICMLDAKTTFKKITDDGRKELRVCLEQCRAEIKISSLILSNSTILALNKSQQLLDTFGMCSQKTGLAVVACYRNIITTDVVPVKNILLEAIRIHRDSHLASIDIKIAANVYIDSVTEKYRDMLEIALADALKCT